MATTTTFSSTVDEALKQQIEAAADLAGIRKVKPKSTGPRVFSYPEGFKPISSVIPMSRYEMDVPIRVFNVTDWPEAVRKFIPKIDPNYVYDPDATLALVAENYSTVDAAHVGAFLLHGPKGSGKTTLPMQICARINMPFIRVNCREDMESSALFGGIKYDPVNGMVWVDGPVPELAKVGGTLCIDEIAKTPAGILVSLMAAFEKDPTIYLADKPGASDEKFIKPVEWFRIVCTDNTELQGDTTGKYVTSNVQDEALVDRIGSAYRLDYLNSKHEIAIITGKVKEVDAMIAAKMVQLAGLIRKAYDGGNVGYTMSPRGLLEWAEKYARWDSIGRAFKLSFWNKLTVTDQQVVAEFYHTVFAENLK